MLKLISSIRERLFAVMKFGFGEDSGFILCFFCSLGTAAGLALFATCFIWDDTSLGLTCGGLMLTAICFGGFLYALSKMD